MSWGKLARRLRSQSSNLQKCPAKGTRLIQEGEPPSSPTANPLRKKAPPFLRKKCFKCLPNVTRSRKNSKSRKNTTCTIWSFRMRGTPTKARQPGQSSWKRRRRKRKMKQSHIQRKSIAIATLC